MWYLWIIVLLLLLIGFIIKMRQNAAIIHHIQNKRKHNKENSAMEELAKQFIGKECIIYTITSESGSLNGIIKEVCAGGMIVESKAGEKQAINLEFVTRIREYPTKKNGKKKSVVID